jgi:hypothetical protein
MTVANELVFLLDGWGIRRDMGADPACRRRCRPRGMDRRKKGKVNRQLERTGRKQDEKLQMNEQY